MSKVELVDRSEFDTKSLKPADRFNVWQNSVGEFYDVSLRNEEDRLTFNAAVESCLLDDIQINHAIVSGIITERGPERIARDGLDHYQLVVYVSGHADVRVGTHIVHPRTGDFINVGLNEEFHSTTTDNEVLNLFIPRRRLAPLLHDPDQNHGVVFDSTTGAGKLLTDYIVSLYKSAPGLSKAQAPTAVEALMILAAMALNGASFNDGEPPEVTDHSLLIRAQTFIRQNLHDADLGPSKIAGALNLSRSRLYRLFAAYDGVADYIREMRLRRAFTDLISPRHVDKQIAEIAYASGFKDPAHFSRLFKARFAAYPTEVREAGADHAAQILPADLPVGDTKYAYWVANLG